MKRFLVPGLVLLLATVPARAHFVFLIPSEPDAAGNSVRMVFSDNLEPDPNPKLLEKITQTELFARNSDGKFEAVKHGIDKDAIKANVPGTGAYLVAGTCKYGVTQRGGTEPFLLVYHPKTFVGMSLKGKSPKLLSESCERLPLEIVPVQNGIVRAVRVLWQGKPLEGADLVVLTPSGKGQEGKTDKDGLLALEKIAGGGLYGFRVRHEEKKAGELDGKKYASVRHYATLTLPLTAGARSGLGVEKTLVLAEEAKAERKADPGATKLLADARAARANWHNFPGFSADMEVNYNGSIHKTRLTVTPKGDVQFKLADEDAGKWARGMLGSLVGHRMDSGRDADSQCAFADTDTTNPLGRAIQVLDDEFHSSYRIRDRQVIVVNRTTKESRFTITVLENLLNEDRHFLPVSYVVNYWDLKGEALKRSVAHHDTWKRVGKFDLPVELLVLTATPTGQEARSIKLSDHRLGSEK